ncbi:hypothetical protein GH714_030115 [Hevea brasiliensis]|uniref:Uncharacterized protein n=1 Tax=Hevea brasiliensis TaxID=3981 RepID=A0A6A6MNW8_HEVBR|nr:hypothetical protein GH714_030115 [Hevea brasiliensis]
MLPEKFSTTVVQESEVQARTRGSKLTGIVADEAEECTSATADAVPFSAAGELDVEAKVEFDLNEGFNGDDGRLGEPNNSKARECSTAVQLISPLPLPVSSGSSGLPALITVASAAKRPFVPPEDLLKNKGELGWKGSAATSAFRPAEPRKALEMLASTTSILEDMASRSTAQGTVSIAALANNHDLLHVDKLGSAPVRNSGGLDLDLNRVDEPTDIGNHLISNGHRLDVQLQQIKSSSGGILNGELSVRRDFDLNDGPLVDEMSVEPSSFGQHNKNSAPSQPSVSGLRMNNTEMGNFSWFSQGNPYSAVTIQSILPDRGEQPFPMVTPGGPQRMLAPLTGSTPLSPDVYRGSVLSSSPAVPFPSTPFQCPPVFPFGTNFPPPTATFSGGSTTYVDSSSGGRLCFPAMHSRVLAPSSAVPSHYPRPFVVSLPDNNNNGNTESSRKWGRQG